MHQGLLDFDAKPPEPPPRADRPAAGATIDERFAAYCAACPETYELFRKLALKMRRAGWKRYSADALLHALRWHHDLQGPRDGGYRLNDHYSRCFSRKLMQDDPTFVGFFETRKLRSAPPRREDRP